jgi:EAL domain-containing protein (putative c-di-GMP-specific phosphodiesterase class I)
MSTEIASIAASFGFNVPRVLDGLEIHLQPIIDVSTGATLAMEALARFGSEPRQPVEEVLAAAHLSGFGYTVEAACLRAALARRAELPDGVRLAVNLSPDVLDHPMVLRSWSDDLDGLIIEITEHQASSPSALQDQFTYLRGRGAAIAVDDVGTGYAGLLRLAMMQPDYVKIDRAVVAGVRDSAAQSAVLEALVTFSHRMGAAVIGEGVETLDTLAALADFDVDYGQGWAIGRPARKVVPISKLVAAACHEARKRVLQRRGAVSVSAANTQGMHAVTSVLARATGLAQLHAATAQAAAELAVDAIGVSVVDEIGELREISSSGAAIDTSAYAVADYPATRTVLQTGNTVEVHVSDGDADAAERLVLERLGHASLLIIPFFVGEEPIGVLELFQRTHRRWTTPDIAHARGLATHLGNALMRINT